MSDLVESGLEGLSHQITVAKALKYNHDTFYKFLYANCHINNPKYLILAHVTDTFVCLTVLSVIINWVAGKRAMVATKAREEILQEIDLDIDYGGRQIYLARLKGLYPCIKLLNNSFNSKYCYFCFDESSSNNI